MRQDHYAVVELLQAQPETSVMLPSQGVRGRTPEIEAQMDSVFKLIVKEGVFSFAIISHEVDYFYNTLGLDAVYFDLHTPAQIAKHIHSFIAAKKVALIGRKSQDICLTLRTGNAMTIICTDENKTQAQDKIDEFMKAGTENEGAHLNYAYSSGPAFEGATQRLAIPWRRTRTPHRRHGVGGIALRRVDRLQHAERRLLRDALAARGRDNGGPASATGAPRNVVRGQRRRNATARRTSRDTLKLARQATHRGLAQRHRCLADPRWRSHRDVEDAARQLTRRVARGGPRPADAAGVRVVRR